MKYNLVDGTSKLTIVKTPLKEFRIKFPDKQLQDVYYSEYIRPFREQQERLKKQRRNMENALNSL